MQNRKRSNKIVGQRKEISLFFREKEKRLIDKDCFGKTAKERDCARERKRKRYTRDQQRLWDGEKEKGRESKFCEKFEPTNS